MSVKVRIDVYGHVLDRKVTVHKHPLSNARNVNWHAEDDGGPWIITFDKPPNPSDPFSPGSPFDEEIYLVHKGKNEKTQGGPKGSTAKGQTYRYTVRDGSFNPTDDPDVDIDD